MAGAPIGLRRGTSTKPIGRRCRSPVRTAAGRGAVHPMRPTRARTPSGAPHPHRHAIPRRVARRSGERRAAAPASPSRAATSSSGSAGCSRARRVGVSACGGFNSTSSSNSTPSSAFPSIRHSTRRTGAPNTRCVPPWSRARCVAAEPNRPRRRQPARAHHRAPHYRSTRPRCHSRACLDPHRAEAVRAAEPPRDPCRTLTR